MKRNLIVLILMPVVFLAISCASRQSASDVLPNANSTPHSSTLVVRNEHGDYIKETGWDIPKFAGDRKYRSFVEKQNGREWKLLDFHFSPSEKTLINLPSEASNVETTWRAIGFQELKGVDQPPFCYGITIAENVSDPMKAHGAVSMVYIKDEDGDGIFETFSDRCLIPSWVK